MSMNNNSVIVGIVLGVILAIVIMSIINKLGRGHMVELRRDDKGNIVEILERAL